MQMTMKALAARAGVSRQAVSSVFNPNARSRVSPTTRQRILRLAREHDFVPDRTAAQLRGAPSRLIGLIGASHHQGVHLILQTELILKLQARGYDVLVSHPVNTDAQLKSVLKVFCARRVEGVLSLSAPRGGWRHDATRLPSVCVSVHVIAGCDVRFDREAGAAFAGCHFIAHGRRRAAFLALEGGGPNQEKFEGLRAAYVAAGFPATQVRFVTCNGTSSALAIAGELQREGIDALLCGNDYIAAKMLSALLAVGCQVPADMALIGFDGYAFCDFTTVPLATIVQPIHKQAREAIRLLFERMESPEEAMHAANVKIQPSLRPSASCGCNPIHTDELLEADKLVLFDNDDLSRECRAKKHAARVTTTDRAKHGAARHGCSVDASTDARHSTFDARGKVSDQPTHTLSSIRPPPGFLPRPRIDPGAAP